MVDRQFLCRPIIDGRSYNVRMIYKGRMNRCTLHRKELTGTSDVAIILIEGKRFKIVRSTGLQKFTKFNRLKDFDFDTIRRNRWLSQILYALCFATLAETHPLPPPICRPQHYLWVVYRRLSNYRVAYRVEVSINYSTLRLLN